MSLTVTNTRLSWGSPSLETGNGSVKDPSVVPHQLRAEGTVLPEGDAYGKGQSGHRSFHPRNAHEYQIWLDGDVISASTSFVLCGSQRIWVPPCGRLAISPVHSPHFSQGCCVS